MALLDNGWTEETLRQPRSQGRRSRLEARAATEAQRVVFHPRERPQYYRRPVGVHRLRALQRLRGHWCCSKAIQDRRRSQARSRPICEGTTREPRMVPCPQISAGKKG